jgi:hypothetical protein
MRSVELSYTSCDSVPPDRSHYHSAQKLGTSPYWADETAEVIRVDFTSSSGIRMVMNGHDLYHICFRLVKRFSAG